MNISEMTALVALTISLINQSFVSLLIPITDSQDITVTFHKQFIFNR